ncbi:hypothetical protein [Paenibacillus sp. NEAU-GSW1]|uniref:hypothetical protein n=1 Tax=Paenibacillus sp. NEAU-GSW1 TaxID=2682486 RepID=UPI001564506E|nr:hypothetical protein [Paenibacillus sp. NEAU-GSW1]
MIICKNNGTIHFGRIGRLNSIEDFVGNAPQGALNEGQDAGVNAAAKKKSVKGNPKAAKYR